MKKNLLFFFIFIFIFSCSHKGMLKPSVKENHEELYCQAMEALEMGDVEKADSLFDRILAVNNNYSPAYGGKAITTAIQSRKEIEGKEIQDIESTSSYEDLIFDCEDNSRSETEKFICYISAIRAYTGAKPEDWIEDADSYYDDALDLNQVKDEELLFYKSHDAIHYFMALAYYEKDEFDSAREILEENMSSMTGKWYTLCADLLQKLK